MSDAHLTVAEIYVRHGFSVYHIDVLAGVPPGTTSRMMQGLLVSKKNAQLVLTTLSVKTQQKYTLENVSVKLLRPLFAELWCEHKLRTDMIAPLAQVSEEVIYAMLRNNPVSKADAEKVLAQVSHVLKQDYTLSTVYVDLSTKEKTVDNNSE